MKYILSFAAITVLFLALALPAMAEETGAPAVNAAGALAVDETGFTLGRFVTCQRIVDREPEGITGSFPEDTIKVYAFLEALDVKKETPVKIQWLFEDKQTAIIELTLGQSKRWRTYSSKRIGIRHGNWEVRLLDSQDNLVKSLTFTVK